MTIHFENEHDRDKEHLLISGELQDTGAISQVVKCQQLKEEQKRIK